MTKATTHFPQESKEDDLSEATRKNDADRSLASAEHVDATVPSQTEYELAVQLFEIMSVRQMDVLLSAIKVWFSQEMMEFDRETNMPRIEASIRLCASGLLRFPARTEARGELLAHMAFFVDRRFRALWKPEDLDQEITLLREALELHPEPHFLRGALLCGLVDAVHSRAMYRTAEYPRLTLYRVGAALLSWTHQQLCRRDGHASDAQSSRARVKVECGIPVHRLVYLVQEFMLYREAFTDMGSSAPRVSELLALIPPDDPTRGAAIFCAVSGLYAGFHAAGKQGDIDGIIAIYQEYASPKSSPSFSRQEWLFFLAMDLELRYFEWGNRQDLDTQVKLLREFESSQDPLQLNSLAIALQRRFLDWGDADDIDAAIVLNRAALALRSKTHLQYSDSLMDLACSLQSRAARRDNTGDNDEAIGLLQTALELGPVENATCLIVLGRAFSTRFDEGGNTEELTRSIQRYRDAIDHLAVDPEAKKSQKGIALNELSGTLIKRFVHCGNVSDLHECIELLRKSLLLPDPDPDPSHSRTCGASRLTLATALSLRYQYNERDADDIDEAIPVRLGWEVVRSHSTPQAEREMASNNLANTLLLRFKKFGRGRDIEDSIKLHQETLSHRHRDRDRSLSNLSNALLERFNLRRNKSDLDEALHLQEQAVRLRPHPHPERSHALNNLANALSQRGMSEEGISAANNFVESEDYCALLGDSTIPNATAGDLSRAVSNFLAATVAESNHLEAAMSAFQAASACPTSSPLFCLVASVEWASKAAMCDHTSALDAFRTAVDLLPRVISISFNPKTRHKMIMEHCTGLASGAATCAVERNEYDTAIELMEASRSVIWAQSLHLRTPLESLGLVESKLASHLAALSREEWDRTTKHVRESVLGFEDFLRPNRMETLRRAAIHGPVVVLNYGHALVVNFSGEIQHENIPRSSPNTHRLTGKQEDDDQRRKVFCVISLDMALYRFPGDSFSQSSGLFAFLPIHAAGIYGIENGESVMDYVVSSYTPTLTALIDSAPPPAATEKSFRMAVIIQPDTPGESHLPHTIDELHTIESKVPKEWLTASGTPESPASVDMVLDSLHAASIVHFCGHATQDDWDPLESALLIGDERLKLAQIMKPLEDGQLTVATRAKSLVFLSACETSKGDVRLPDESIHLAASLLFAGFRGVIATMWQMDDRDGPEIATEFYGRLFNNTDATSDPPTYPDVTEAARALHLAVVLLARAKHASEFCKTGTKTHRTTVDVAQDAGARHAKAAHDDAWTSASRDSRMPEKSARVTVPRNIQTQRRRAALPGGRSKVTRRKKKRKMRMKTTGKERHAELIQTRHRPLEVWATPCTQGNKRRQRRKGKIIIRTGRTSWCVLFVLFTRWLLVSASASVVAAQMSEVGTAAREEGHVFFLRGWDGGLDKGKIKIGVHGDGEGAFHQSAHRTEPKINRVGSNLSVREKSGKADKRHSPLPVGRHLQAKSSAFLTVILSWGVEGGEEMSV
ncbi:CHAT domain-containing protein [Mycena rebaudengoi]|nr:CHAT domain-containing protein [Mycena rebaudengoi]